MRRAYTVNTGEMYASMYGNGAAQRWRGISAAAEEAPLIRRRLPKRRGQVLTFRPKSRVACWLFISGKLILNGAAKTRRECQHRIRGAKERIPDCMHARGGLQCNAGIRKLWPERRKAASAPAGVEACYVTIHGIAVALENKKKSLNEMKMPRQASYAGVGSTENALTEKASLQI